jgi:hypothetical protein
LPEIPRKRWSERVTSLLSLISVPKNMFVLFTTLQPVLDYFKVMRTRRTDDHLLAGNVILSIEPDENEEIKIKYARIFMDNGADVANRTMRVMLYETAGSAVFSTKDYLTVTANNSAELFCNEFDIADYIEVDADTAFHWCPNEAIEGMQHRFYYVNGVAADEVRYQLKLEINPVPKEFL